MSWHRFGLLGYSDATRCDRIESAFEQAYKSPISIIVLDDIERLLNYVPIGPRFSNEALQTLMVLPPFFTQRLYCIYFWLIFGHF